MRARRPATGFSIVEMMVALAIGAMLVAMAAPSFNSYLRNTEIRTATESLLGALRVARSEAVRRNQSVTVEIPMGSYAAWTVRQASDNATIQTHSTGEGSTSVAVSRIPSSATLVQFNGLGRLVVPDVNSPPNIRQLDIAAPGDSTARSLRILVDEASGIRSCDPSPLLVGLSPPDPRAC
jgi:type IV fimbrial biogenesis protein FimT